MTKNSYAIYFARSIVFWDSQLSLWQSQHCLWLEIPCIDWLYGPREYTDKMKEIIDSLKTNGFV